MANRSQVQAAISACLNQNPMTTDRALRELSAAGFVPRVAPGKRSPHYGLDDLTNVVLSLAAPIPSEAPSAVQKLNTLVYDRERSTQILMQMGEERFRFRDLISIAIRQFLDRGNAAKCVAVTNERRARGEADFQITMCLDPLWACLTIPGEIIPNRLDARGQLERRADQKQWYLPQDSELLAQTPPAGFRPFIMDYTLLVTAAELLADTLARQTTTLIPDLAPGSAGEGEATPETMKASGTGIHEGLQSYVPATRAYPAPAPTVALQAQFATKEGSNQSASQPVARESRVRQPATVRTRHHGANWSAASPA